MFAAAMEGLIWLGGVGGGFAVLWSVWKAARRFNLASDVLVGKWFGYSYFYDPSGVRFYRETCLIYRSGLFPWRLRHKTTPSGPSEVTQYTGDVHYRAPYVYMSSHDNAEVDYTYDIGRLVMGANHKYDTIVALHLGNSYEETVHSASAYLLVRNQLDPSANENAQPTATEERLYREAISSFIRVDREHLQIQLTPPQRRGAR